jgi:hypothetical protein
MNIALQMPVEDDLRVYGGRICKIMKYRETQALRVLMWTAGI